MHWTVHLGASTLVLSTRPGRLTGPSRRQSVTMTTLKIIRSLILSACLALGAGLVLAQGYSPASW